MKPSRVLNLALAAFAATLVFVPAVASASTYDDYSQDGSIGACDYSAGQLQGDIDGAPADIRQYDPGYVEALNRALNERASGACDGDDSGGSGNGGGGGGGSGGDTAGTSALAADGSAKPPGTKLGAGSAINPGDLAPASSDTPGWLKGLAIGGGLSLLAALLFMAMFARTAMTPVGHEGRFGSVLADYWWGVRDRFGR